MSIFNQKYLDEIENLKSQLNYEKEKNRNLGINSYQDAVNRISQLESESQNKLAMINNSIVTNLNHLESLKNEVYNLETVIKQKKKEVLSLDEEITLQEFGLYTPVYKFANSEQYKDRLLIIRQQQKNLVKNKTAVFFPESFSYNNSLSKGKALVNDNVKQILRSFNNECDVLINNVKFNTIDNTRSKIEKSFEQLNKMNEKMNIFLNTSYLELKLDELQLAYEYARKKEEEKEAQKEERARLREEAKLQKELEEARKTAEKEKMHYENALATIINKLSLDPQNEELISKQKELQEHLNTIDTNIKDIDYREANKRAGYVYIISNIGSFGEDVYKIGMTRRLEPMDRINELGDASVPFNFDVHALIFSDDAPALENALHHAFEDKKVNMVNPRREFFRVSLEEIEEVIKANFDKTVDFKRIPEAEQYRETKVILNN